MSRRCAVKICCVVGWPEGGLGAADIDESEGADGEAGDGDWEESNWRWAIVSFARGGLLEPVAPDVSKWCPGMMISPTVDQILLCNEKN